VKTMAFPKQLLADHERLVLDLRPHWIALVLPVAATVLLIAAEAIVFVAFDPPPWLAWVVVLAGLAVFLAFPARAFLAWATSHFVVTSDRVIHRSGWLAKSSMEIPLERINDVKFRQSVLERMVGAGDLVIESGGEYGQNRFSDIRAPEEVQKLIYEKAEENQRRDAGAGAPVPEADDPLDQLEQLARLRAEGSITEDEFEVHKRRLLGKL
jgi:uncharacterized membrane protein YdbT with pleckstrin-like domain